MLFEPQRLPANRALAWFRQGAALAMRKPLQLIILILAPCALAAAMEVLAAPFIAAGFPLLVGLGVLVASSADDSVSSALRIMQVGRAAWLRLAAAAFVMFLFNLSLALGVIALAGGFDQPIPSTPLQSPVAMVGKLFTTTFALLHLAWHIPTLLLFAGMPFRMAFVHAQRAALLNPVTLLLPLCLSLADEVLGSLSFLLIPLYPFVVCAMYVSFREIWLGRLENRPVARKSASASVATQTG